MQYKIQEHIQELEDYISHNQEKFLFVREKIASRDADILWDASRFFANVLLQAEGYYFSISEEELKDIHEAFCTEHYLTIDISLLYSRHWLRKVLGRFRIAGQVNRDLYEFNRVKPYLTELKFLLAIEIKYRLADQKVETGLTKDLVEKEREAYENEKQISLKTEGIYFNRWYEESKNQFSSIANYFKHFIEFENEFNFLQTISSKIIINSKLHISVEDLEKIHQIQYKKFSKTPSLDQLEKKQFIFKDGDKYRLNLIGGNPQFWRELIDEITGHLWENILEQGGRTDVEALVSWLEKIAHFEDLPDPIKYITSTSAKRFLDAAYQCLISETDLDEPNREKYKLFLESGGRSFYFTYNPEKFLADSPNFDTESTYSMYQSLQAFDQYFQRNILYDQPSRQSLHTLVNIIVLNDPKYSIPGLDYQESHKRVIGLLENGIQKPYLLYKVLEEIANLKPQLVCYLLQHTKLHSLGICILDKIKLVNKSDTTQALWKLSSTLLLATIQYNSLSEKESALIVYRLFQLINQDRLKSFFLPRMPKCCK